MPIECFIQPDDGGVMFEIGSIEPSRCFTFEDFSRGTLRIIAAYCYGHDLGGQVHEFEKPEFETMMENAVNGNGFVDLSRDTKLGDILPNGLYVEPIADLEGERAELILRHRMPNTQSTN